MAELTHIQKQEAPEVKLPRGWGIENHGAMASMPTASTQYGSSSVTFRDFFVFSLAGPRTVWFDSRFFHGRWINKTFRLRWFVARSNSDGKPLSVYDFYDKPISHMAYHTFGAGIHGIGAAEYEPEDPEDPWIFDTQLLDFDFGFLQLYASAASGLSNFGDIELSLEQPDDKLPGELWTEQDYYTVLATERT